MPHDKPGASTKTAAGSRLLPEFGKFWKTKLFLGILVAPASFIDFIGTKHISFWQTP